MNSSRTRWIIAGLVALIGVAVIGVSLTHLGSARGYVASHFTRAGSDRVQGARRESPVYRSARSATATAKQIADARKPADRRVTAAGIFLRYRDDIITVTPQGPGASRIVVDDADAGYNRGFVYLGGWWGSYSGRAEGFRGGGSGAGK